MFATKTYERAIKKLLPAESRGQMENAIVENPTAGPVIPGTGGIRKIRWSMPGRGKRGGIRTIYFYRARPEEIYLLTVYGKTARDDLTPGDRKAWSALVAAIKKEGKGK